MTEEIHFRNIFKHPFYLISFTSVLLFFGIKLLDLLNFNSIKEYLILSLDIKTSILRPWTYIVSMFIHRDFFHLVGNMLVLYIFYSIYETFLLQKPFIKYFITGGIISFLLTQLLFLFFEAQGYLIGASASVFFVGMYAACCFPDYSVRVMLLPPIRLKWFMFFLALLMILTSTPTNFAGLISHLFGLLGGYAFYLIKQRTFLKKNQTKIHLKNHQSSDQLNTILDSEVLLNKLLDKINEKGFESLTDKERSELEKLSGKFKK